MAIEYFQSMLTELDGDLIPQADIDRKAAMHRRRILEVDVTIGGMEPEAYSRLLAALTPKERIYLQLNDRFQLRYRKIDDG